MWYCTERNGWAAISRILHDSGDTYPRLCSRLYLYIIDPTPLPVSITVREHEGIVDKLYSDFDLVFIPKSYACSKETVICLSQQEALTLFFGNNVVTKKDLYYLCYRQTNRGGNSINTAHKPMVTLNNALNAVNSYLCENDPSRIVYNLDLIIKGWIGSRLSPLRSIEERLDMFDSYLYLRDFFQTLEKILRTKHTIKTRDAAILDAILTFRAWESNTIDHLDKLIDGWDESPISCFEGLEGVGIEVTETYEGLFDLIIVLIKK